MSTPTPTPEEIKAFCHAARDGDIATVALYLEEYGDRIVNARDTKDINDAYNARAITWAAFNGRDDVIRLLLSCNADVNGGGTDDRSALNWASAYAYPDTVRLLLWAGADQDQPDVYEKTARQRALDANHPDVLAVYAEWDIELERRRIEAERLRAEEESRREEIASQSAINQIRKIRSYRFK